MLVGAKGGGGSKFVQKPDTLRSEDTFEGLLGLCAGPIKGPVRGMKSVRVNGTPIEDETGKANFQNFSAIFADGDPLKHPQVATLKLGSAGAPDNINITIGNTNPSGTPGPWITHTLNNTGAEAIDLRFVVQQLYKQSKDGIFENTLHLDIQMKPVGTTTWINPFASNGNTTPAYSESGYDMAGKGGTVRLYSTTASYTASTTTGTNLTITGKTTSPFVKELRVQVPNEGVYANKGWDIRVRLVEPESVDADPNFEKRTVSWESATAVFSGQLGNNEEWRAFSWLQLYGKASDNFNGVPEIDGVYDTKIVSVPPSTVYNPSTRVYSGTVWDGSWAKSFTQDPAWIINDAISDSISGLSTFAPGAYLNKWDALELSKWCSELVPDGAGGSHPRHSLNLFVDQPQKSDEFIRYLAGAVGATAWDDGGGQWRIKADRPQTPVDVFTTETIEGEFRYSHTDVDTRHNDVTVVFLNEEFDYREDRVRVVNQADIDKHGRKTTRIVGIGITNRQQALRWAVLRLRTNINEFRAVSFTTNRRGKLLERFDQILIADGTLNDDASGNMVRSTGRIISQSGSTISLRDTVRLEVGVSYLLHVTQPNANYNPDPTGQPANSTWQQPTLTITRTITNDAAHRGDVRDLVLDTALPADVAPNANVALEAVGLPAIPKVFRIIDIEPVDAERVNINAVEVDTGKWAAADAATDDNISLVLADGPPPPIAPATGVLSVGTFPSTYATGRVLYANWVRPLYKYADGYRLQRRLNNGPWLDLGRTRLETFELTNPAQGLHEFRIYTLDVKGRKSIPLEASLNVTALFDSPVVGLLTNEAHTVAALADGTGFDLSNAGGTFQVFNGMGRVTTGVTYTVVSETGCDVSIAADGTYTVNSLSADQASAVFRATVSGFAVPVEKTYTITKARGGFDGSSAKLLFVISDRQTIAYDGTGAPTPTGQTITFTAQKQNTTATVNWTVTDINGVAQTPTTSFLSAASGNSVTMTEAQFASARNGTSGVIVKATLTDGATLTDQISIVKVAAGAPGAPGANGLSVREITVYKRAATVPAVPTGGSYNFGTGVLTPPAGWSTTIPTGANPLWGARGDVSIVGQTGSATPTWLGVGSLAADGSAVNIIFKRSVTQPVAPAASAGLPSGWADTVDGATGTDPMWASFGTRPDSQSNWFWQTPVRQQGLDGAGGPVIALTADALSFDFIDGVTMNASQTITVTATKQNTAEAINWSVSPAVTLGAPNGNQRTLTIANFGNNMRVTITAVGATSGAQASVTLTRNNITTPNDSIIPDSGWRSGVAATDTAWRRTGLVRTAIP